MPPQPNRGWHLAKWLFNRLYWETVPAGPVPENAPMHETERSITMSTTVTKTLDLKGLSCPLPIAKTAKAMRELDRAS